MTKHRHAFFSALVQEKEESVKFALTFSFRMVIRTFTIKKKNEISKIQLFFQKNWHRLIASLISFNPILGFKYV